MMLLLLWQLLKNCVRILIYLLKIFTMSYIHFTERFACHPNDFKLYDTSAIRNNFLISDLFKADEIKIVYSHFDRFITGSAVPVKNELFLNTIDPLKAEFFLQRRELGIINIGGEGSVIADGQTFNLGYKEALYLGKETKNVRFLSKNSEKPAKFYFNSTPAHCKYPNKQIRLSDAEVVEAGAPETANARKINKLIVNSIVQTCQLQMGMTELKPGSVWNTMPPHVHSRRMEVYLYFDVPEKQAICHYMGQPDETRHLWLKNEQAVISPDWSIHSASGTSNYCFIWGMAGENLDYNDMDVTLPSDLK
jgi:4-deoxy-L-threo-5-hexosulose-uronate ketol-isomerase